MSDDSRSSSPALDDEKEERIASPGEKDAIAGRKRVSRVLLPQELKIRMVSLLDSPNYCD
jgi:hypothetical protein